MGEVAPAVRVAVVTAVMPTGADHLHEAYESLLDQTPVQWRWLIQVDGDDTACVPLRILSDCRVSAAANGRHCGAGITRNNALSRCEQTLVQTLDADDRLLPGALAVLAGALQDHPSAAFAFGRAQISIEDGTHFDSGDYEPYAPGLIPAGVIPDDWRRRGGPPLHPAGPMWRADILRAYGGWAALAIGEDTSVMVAATVHHPCVNVDCDTLWYRWHHSGGQLSRSATAREMAGVKMASISQRIDALRRVGAV